MAFWDKQSAPQAPQPQQAPSNTPWWQPETSAPTPPPPQYQQPQHQLMQQGPPQNEYQPPSGLKSRGAENCPECDSVNFMEFKKDRVFTKNGVVSTFRCFDCGYPVDNDERGTGKIVGDVNGHARQIAGAGVVPNFHPEIIVARAGGPRGPRTQ